MLSDKDIATEVSKKNLTIEPFLPHRLQPASYDVRLSESFAAQVPDDDSIIDPMNETSYVSFWTGEYLLRPGAFVLGSTIESVGLPEDIAAKFEGKSTLGRLGLMTHVTAGFIDPGFHGNITVELVNVSKKPILLTRGMPIGQLCFFRTDSTPYNAYGRRIGSHYQSQIGATPPKPLNITKD